MTGHHTSTTDKYLEAIYCIAHEGEAVRPGRLAEWLSVSAPTVSDALQRLRRDGWIDIAPDRSVTLSECGDATATSLIRRHRILERWLTDVLGFDWASADVEADRLSSAVSDVVVDHLDASMGAPLTCPHGNVIPGRLAPYGELLALADAPVGVTVTVRRISEVAEHEAPALLTELARVCIGEGSLLTVLHASANLLTLELAGRPFDLPVVSARLIWVEVATGQRSPRTIGDSNERPSGIGSSVTPERV